LYFPARITFSYFIYPRYHTLPYSFGGAKLHITCLQNTTQNYQNCHFSSIHVIPNLNLKCTFSSTHVIYHIIFYYFPNAKCPFLLESVLEPASALLYSSYILPNSHVSLLPGRAPWPRSPALLPVFPLFIPVFRACVSVYFVAEYVGRGEEVQPQAM
jgi:hypothetical protein